MAAETRVMLLMALATSAVVVMVSLVTLFNLYGEMCSLNDEVAVSMDEFKVEILYINQLRFIYGKLPEAANYYGMR